MTQKSTDLAAAQRVGAATALALHGLVGIALLGQEPVRSMLSAAAPIFVEIITLPRVEPKREPPVEISPPRPRPKPVAKPKPHPLPPGPPPAILAPAEAPAAIAAQASPLPAPSPVEPAPLATAPAIASTVAPSTSAAVVPITPPVFNADYLSNPEPAYPALSRRLGEQGRVLLRVLVSPTGRADEVQIRTSSGFRRLDDSARESVQRWKFVPAKRGDEAVPAWVLIPVVFGLEG